MLKSILFVRGGPQQGAPADIGLLALRLLTGSFLMWETQDNILSAERMAEFVGFVGHHGFILPEIMAPLSVYAQFICGALILAGALTRAASLVMVFNFVVALAMVHWGGDFRNWWPALVLVFIPLHFALAGPGRWSVDHWLARRETKAQA
ncbi:DoxX family protein [Glycocaulis abyssi]|uniref:DoxX family protein n=1 Tax=Glycocaulis abyssi TaxID=1433403 RepID=A0ABV9NAJ8_9PROT